ncbi:FKBP-type peptidyl-prolyl cis-trans isomerase FkpA [Mucilaginibacter sp. UYP25]|uniref:FKBP-type peptidyl-prolyl cis-trans isomerase n=1 Tax=unclassified Mucilaginibacter TaxID=2617802 RepID=UPI00339A8EF1
MKKFVFVLLLAVAGLASCKKEKTVSVDEQAIIDDSTIQAYLTANPSITATKDPSGVYYQNITAGTGDNPTAASTVTVNYVGKLLSGQQFDAGNYTTSLGSDGQVIEGWKIGLLHGKKDGRILLIIPSRYAYGVKGQGSIPGNAPLIFTIDVLSFK